MQKYYINTILTVESNGGSKAKSDINIILKKMGFEEIYLPCRGKQTSFFSKFTSIIEALCLFKLSSSSVVFFQSPSNKSILFDKMVLYAKRIKKFKLIVIIHDIEELRKIYVKNAHYIFNERQFFNISDAIICHNESMKSYLIKQGKDRKKIFPIEIFDYMIDGNFKINNIINQKNEIVVAGNLSYKKSAYIYDLGELVSNNLIIRLYGPEYEEKRKNDKVIFEGCYLPDEVPKKLRGGWGLVWDGNSIETCQGNTGDYLIYINQHKASLYLASGLPIIIWEKAGLAPYVKKNKVGICITSLRDIEKKINAITDEEYKLMCENVEQIRQKLMDGFYAEKVVRNAEQFIENTYGK